MTDQKLFSAKEFFESEWYKDGLKQLCADGWPTFVVPVNIKIRELIEEIEKLRAENERMRSLVNQQSMVEVIMEWKHFWMNQTQNDEQDYKNYLHRAMGVDANMKYDLANRIVKALRGADEKD